MMSLLQVLAAALVAQTGATGASAPSGGRQGAVESAAPYWETWLRTTGLGVLKALVVFAVAWVLAVWVRRAIRAASHRARVDITLAKFLSNLARWAIVAVAIVTCLNTFGIETTSFAALIGAAGLAIGLGFQGSLGHFAAGVMLLIFRPFKVGDTVTVAGQQGTVNEIDLLITELDTPDGRRVIVPNGQVFGSIIENMSHHPRRRVDVSVNVPPESPAERTREVLEGVARSVRGRLEEPAPEVVVNEITHVYVQWVLRVWVKREDYGAVRAALLAGAREALEGAGLVKVAEPAKPEGAGRW